MEPYRREGGERVGGHGRRARILAAAAVLAVLGLLAGALAGLPAPASRSGQELGVVLSPAEDGARVLAVMAGSAAEQAGVEPGDLLLTMNGAALTEADIPSSCFRTMEPGTDLELERGGRRIHCTLGR